MVTHRCIFMAVLLLVIMAVAGGLQLTTVVVAAEEAPSTAAVYSDPDGEVITVSDEDDDGPNGHRRRAATDGNPDGGGAGDLEDAAARIAARAAARRRSDARRERREGRQRSASSDGDGDGPSGGSSDETAGDASSGVSRGRQEEKDAKQRSKEREKLPIPKRLELLQSDVADLEAGWSNAVKGLVAPNDAATNLDAAVFADDDTVEATATDLSRLSVEAAVLSGDIRRASDGAAKQGGEDGSTAVAAVLADHQSTLRRVVRPVIDHLKQQVAAQRALHARAMTAAQLAVERAGAALSAHAEATAGDARLAGEAKQLARLDKYLALRLRRHKCASFANLQEALAVHALWHRGSASPMASVAAAAYPVLAALVTDGTLRPTAVHSALALLPPRDAAAMAVVVAVGAALVGVLLVAARVGLLLVWAAWIPARRTSTGTAFDSFRHVSSKVLSVVRHPLVLGPATGLLVALWPAGVAAALSGALELLPSRLQGTRLTVSVGAAVEAASAVDLFFTLPQRFLWGLGVAAVSTGVDYLFHFLMAFRGALPAKKKTGGRLLGKA